jgi:two-component system nitrate/nitrite response regulator NarL
MALSSGQELAVAANSPRAAAMELLHRLVASAGEDDVPRRVLRRTVEAVEEIMLEFEFEGTRYFLVRSQPLGDEPRGLLSPRELAIARLIAKGLPNKCVGDLLEISPWTVATHLRRIFGKLGVTSRAAMVARLGEQNLL